MSNRAASSAHRLERWLVHLVALHSAAVGIGLLCVPRWALPLAGWPGESAPLFFPRQAGVFHLVAALAYVGELRRYGGVRLLVATKTIAFCFLATAWLAGENAWSVPFSALADGAMGAVVAWAHRAASRAGPPISS